MEPVTDPALLAQLEAAHSGGAGAVTDPDLIKQLEAAHAVNLAGSAKSVATGLGKGAAYVMGLPGDLGRGVDWLFDKVAGPATPEQQAQLNALRPPSSATLINAADKAGIVHHAQNGTEQSIENVASFIPASLGGPEALVANAIKRGLIPGLASEGARKTFEGTPLEVPAAIAGSLVSMGPKRIPVASAEDVTQAGANAFDAFRQMPFSVNGKSMDDFARSTLGDFGRNRGFTARTAPDTTDLLSGYLGGNPSRTVTSNNIDELRQLLRDVQTKGGTGPRDREAAGAALMGLKDRINSFQPADVVSGDLRAAQSMWNQAHANTTAGLAAKTFDAIDAKAVDQAQGVNSGLNAGNKLRSAYANALNDYKKTRGLRDSEVEQLQKIVNGTLTGNATRFIANTLGGGGGIGGLIASRIIGGLAGGGAGAEVGGGTGSGIGAGIGTFLLANMMRRGYNRSVMNQSARLSEAIRSRSPLGQMSIPALGPHVSPGIQRLVNMAHAIQIAHGNQD